MSVGSRVSAGAVLATIGGESAENSLADAALAVQNTDDSGSQSTGGLYSGISSTDSWSPIS